MKLDLLSDTEFVSPPRDLLATIIGLPTAVLGAALEIIVGAGSASSETDQLARAVKFFQSNLTIKRIGLTYIVEVAYRSLDPNKAAKISNAVTDTHLLRALESKYNAAYRTSGWLRDRIDELKTQAQTAERAVAEYKAKNNVLDGSSRLLSEQELADLSNQRRVVLKDLESSAQTYRTLHEAFVQRATQMQSFPTAEARVISPASPPLEKSHPKSVLVMGAACLLGLVGGVAAAFAREHLNTAFLSPTQLEREAGINCLGIFPFVPRNRSSVKSEQENANGNVPHLDRAMSRDHAARRRVIVHDPERYTCVLDRASSPCREAIEFLAADIGVVGRKTIGICSALPREGKSLIAANLSEFVAESGRKVLLVDCDLRNMSLTRQFAPAATQGLREAIASRLAVNNLVWCDPMTGLDFLPAGLSGARTVHHPSGALSSTSMHELLISLQSCYDLVVLDLPSIIPFADVKAASHLIESFILVIKWGHTSHATVADALNTAPLVSEKLLGAVLNKAKPAVLRRLSYRGRYFRGAGASTWSRPD